MIKYRVYDTKQNKYLHPDTVSISGSGTMSFAGTGGKYHAITQPFKSAFSKAESIQPDIAIDDMHACELGNINLIVREK